MIKQALYGTLFDHFFVYPTATFEQQPIETSSSLVYSISVTADENRT